MGYQLGLPYRRLKLTLKTDAYDNNFLAHVQGFQVHITLSFYAAIGVKHRGLYTGHYHFKSGLLNTKHQKNTKS